MIRLKDHKTRYMFSPFEHLGKKRLKLLESSWAGVFRDHVRPILPVELLADHYSQTMGRPSHELVAMMGSIVLQQMHDLSDEETVSHFAFNIQWHYALDITSPADAYVCPRTIWNVRHLMAKHNLYEPVFNTVRDALAKVFEVDTSLQRLDSVHIFSNMRHLGRIGIFASTIRKFLTNLKRHHRALFDALEASLTDRYLRKQDEAAFSMVKPSESAKTLDLLAADLFFLIERFSTTEAVASMHSYKLLVRMLKEQCIVKDPGGEKEEISARPNEEVPSDCLPDPSEDQGIEAEGGGQPGEIASEEQLPSEHPQTSAADAQASLPTVSVKPNKQVPSSSLQNPSDPDAGYDAHKGKGYQVQVAETCCAQEDKEAFSLITYVEVEPAHKNDANALIPYLESATEHGMAPETVLADTLYGSDDNHEQARVRGTELVSPCMGTEGGLADFTFSEDGRVACCPKGHSPVQTKRKESRFTARFASETCSACPLVGECPVKAGKRGHYLRYDKKALRLARRRAAEKSAAFKEKYRLRAGIEATMSQFDRRTSVKHLRVRGMKAVRFAVFLKATGVNIFRAAAFRGRTNKGKSPLQSAACALASLFHLVKERFAPKSASNYLFFLNMPSAVCPRR